MGFCKAHTAQPNHYAEMPTGVEHGKIKQPLNAERPIETKSGSSTTMMRNPRHWQLAVLVMADNPSPIIFANFIG